MALARWSSAATAVCALAILFVGASSLPSVAAGPQARSESSTAGRGPYDAFRVGLLQERVHGNLEAAISAYERARTSAGDDRALAARASLRIGRCLEKLGRADARDAYEAVLSEHADQVDIVERARSRLASILPSPTGFAEEFTSATLDPAWVVVDYIGPYPRSHGFTSPANEFSLSANPGHLRYIPDRMTHGDGFQNGYEPRLDEGSALRYDAGLELHRYFSGDRWLLESKASYVMPFSNARFLKLVVLFGDGAAGSIIVDVRRFRDGPWPVGTAEITPVLMVVDRKTGPGLLDTDRLLTRELPPNPADTYFYRVERDAGVLTASWSTDRDVWQTAFVRDLGDALDGLQQRVIVSGGSWFAPGDSFVDYDYIRVTPR